MIYWFNLDFPVYLDLTVWVKSKFKLFSIKKFMTNLVFFKAKGLLQERHPALSVSPD